MKKSETFAVILSAPSGAGKSTLIKRLLAVDSSLEFAVSTTTRGKRPGEEDGKNYYFVSSSEFEQMIKNGNFLEWANVHGNYYGTTKKEIDRIKGGKRIPLLDIDVQGGESLRHIIGEALFVFLVPPSLDILEKRLRGRGTEADDVVKLRLKNALIELEKYTEYDYVLVNDDLDQAVADFESVIKAELLKKDRMKYKIKELLGK